MNAGTLYPEKTDAASLYFRQHASIKIIFFRISEALMSDYVRSKKSMQD